MLHDVLVAVEEPGATRCPSSYISICTMGIQGIESLERYLISANFCFKYV